MSWLDVLQMVVFFGVGFLAGTGWSKDQIDEATEQHRKASEAYKKALKLNEQSYERLVAAIKLQEQTRK